MDDHVETPSCNCHNKMQEKEVEKPIVKIKKTARALPSLFMSLLIAFFPKCPFCWAIYMSMFGSLGLARLPYMPWLMPVLLFFLAFHLFMLFRKAPQKGYLPFIVSLAGAIVIISARNFFPLERWLAITGMALIISGSLLNNFSGLRITINQLKRV